MGSGCARSVIRSRGHSLAALPLSPINLSDDDNASDHPISMSPVCGKGVPRVPFPLPLNRCRPNFLEANRGRTRVAGAPSVFSHHLDATVTLVTLSDGYGSDQQLPDPRSEYRLNGRPILPGYAWTRWE